MYFAYPWCAPEPWAVSFTLSGPSNLAASIPHLLGFHPTESFVFVWMSDDRIVLTQRIDAAALDEMLMNPALLIESASHVGGTVVLVTYFPHDPDVDPGCLLDLAAALEVPGVTVLDALLIGRDWWRSVLCQETCCTQGPRAFDAEVLDRVAAGFVLDGVAVLCDRDQLVAEVVSEPTLVAEALEQWIPHPDYPALVAICVARWQCTEPRTRIEMREMVSHLVALDDVAVRDALIWYLAQLDSIRLRHTAVLLRNVLRVAPPGHVAPIASLAGIAAWLSGDGARALIALDRGLSDDPGYRLALMVQAALGAGVPPSDWREMVLQVAGADICIGIFGENPV